MYRVEIGTRTKCPATAVTKTYNIANIIELYTIRDSEIRCQIDIGPEPNQIRLKITLFKKNITSRKMRHQIDSLNRPYREIQIVQIPVAGPEVFTGKISSS